MSQNGSKGRPRGDLHGQQYFESFADTQIRDFLKGLGFARGKCLLIVCDGGKITISRPPEELLPKMREAIEWVVQTRGNATFGRGPEGGGA
jgi:hypothetical protein